MTMNFRNILLIAGVVLASLDGINAGMDKGTASPSTSTPSHTASPSRTAFPSKSNVPSVISTTFPLAPSKFPTASSSPSNVSMNPSLAPSTLPTFLSSLPPSQVLATSKPTSHLPTQTPSIKPSLALVKVTLPIFVIAFDVKGSFEKKTLESSLNNFTSEVILSREALGDCTNVNLQVSSAINYDTGLFEDGRPNHVVVTMFGVAFYNIETTPAPTMDEITALLKVYFGYQGDDDMMKELSQNNRIITNLQITVDGELVSTIDGYDPGQSNIFAPATKDNGGTSTMTWLLSGIMGCVVLLTVFALLMWQRRHHKAERHEITSLNAIGSPTVARSSPQSGSRNDVNYLPSHFEDDDSYGGVVSLEDSMYTTATDQVYQPSQGLPDQYDAKRLDKVISNAHDFVASQDDPLTDQHTYS